MNDLAMLYGFHVHVTLSILALYALTLLYRWIVATQTPRVQRNIAVWTLLVCSAGIAITVPYCLAGWRLMGSM